MGLGSEAPIQPLNVERAKALLHAAERADRQLDGPGRGTWLQRMEASHPETLAALDWFLSDGARADLALRLAAAMTRFWWGRGHWEEGRSRLGEVLRQAEGHPASAAYVRALDWDGVLAWSLGDLDLAYNRLVASVEMARALGHESVLGASLTLFGLVCSERGEMETSLAAYEESIELFRRAEDRWGEAWAIYHLGLWHEAQEAAAEASSMYEECLLRFREAGDDVATARPLLGLATLAHKSGNGARALELAEESLVRRRASLDKSPIASVAALVGTLAREQSDLDRAFEAYEEALALYQDLNLESKATQIRKHLGYLALQLDDLLLAKDQFKEAISASVDLNDPVLASGCLAGFAAAIGAEGRLESSAKVMGWVDARIDSLEPEERSVYSDHRELVLQQLGDAAFEDAAAQGGALSLVEISLFSLQAP